MTPETKDFLLKEYDAAKELSFEIDDLRHKITTFYGTLATLAVAALGLFVKSGQPASPPEQLGHTLPIVLFAVGVMGGLVIRALARLRRTQLEHFRIINNIRDFFFKLETNASQASEARMAVELSSKTLPKPNRGSGSYMWVAMVILVSASFIAASLYSTFVVEKCANEPLKWLLTLGLFAVVYVSEDILYLRTAKPPAPPNAA